MDAPGALKQEREALEALIDSNDLGTIIRQNPIRRTGALDQISKHLGFDDQKEYARAILKLLKDDEDMLKHVREVIGPLPSDLIGEGGHQAENPDLPETLEEESL